MAHRFPTCRSRCHCLGDIDDMMVDDAPEESTCMCCPDPDDDVDEAFEDVFDGGDEDRELCEICLRKLTSEDHQVNDGLCVICRVDEPFNTDRARCRICGCTDDDCSQCMEKTGEPCSWVDDDLCSACLDKDTSTKVDVCACGYITENCKMGISTDCPRTTEH